MDNLPIGIKLLFLVFLVLLFLRYMMRAKYRLLDEESTSEIAPPPQRMAVAPTASELTTDEIVAIITAVRKMLPPNHQGVVRINTSQINDTEEELMAVAAIAGALAVAGR